MYLTDRLNFIPSFSHFAILFIASIITIPCLSQNLLNDQQLLQEQDFKVEKFEQRKVSVLVTKSNNPIIKYNPLSLTFAVLLYGYQKVVSPQLSTNCPYKISCSAFSKQCIHEFGLIKGVALSADRLTRCTKFSLKDIHPLNIDKRMRKINDGPEKYIFNK